MTTSFEIATEAALFVLERGGGSASDLPLLAALVAEHLPAEASDLFAPVAPTSEGVTRAVEGWAGWIEGRGTPHSALRALAADDAEEMRKRAHARIAAGDFAWYTDPQRFPRIVAHVVWAWLERQAPGIRTDRHETLLAVNRSDLGLDARSQIVADGRPVGLLEPGQAGIISAAATLEALRTLGSAYVMPMAEYLVELVQVGHGPYGVRVIDEATIEFASWEVFSRGLLEGREPRDHYVALFRDLANVLGHTRIQWTDGTTSTAPWILNDDARRPGRPRAIHPPTFTLDAGLRRNAAAGTGQRVIPNVRPRIVPHIDVGDHLLAAQFRFVRHLQRHFVRHSDQLAEKLGVEVTPAEVSALADESRLPGHLAGRYLDHLVQHGVIERDEAGLLAPAHRATRDFIVEGWTRATRKKAEAGAARRGNRRKARKP